MKHLGHNSMVTAYSGRVIVLAEASSGVPLKGNFQQMARRYQRGSLVDRGDHWVGRWREDVIKEKGGQKVIERPMGWHFLGTKQDYPTKKLALRALADRPRNRQQSFVSATSDSEVFRVRGQVAEISTA